MTPAETDTHQPLRSAIAGENEHAKVSVVVCTRNRAELLREAVKSLCELNLNEDYSVEVLVVDNGSSDHTRDVVREAAEASTQVNLVDVVRHSGLNTWDFHGLHPADALEERFKFDTYPSPYLDLTDGFGPFLTRTQSRSTTIKRQRQKTRALARDVGPIRLDYDVRDPMMLEHLIVLKRHKYARTGAFDVLSVPWCANLLRELFQTRTEDFGGILSAMWAGSQLAAVHLGIFSGGVVLCWFPVYDPRFAKYSPGTQLLLEIARAACDHGVHTVDLSYGPDPFKYKISSDCWRVCRGQIQFNSWQRRRAKHSMAIAQMIKRSRLKDAVKGTARAIMPWIGRGDYR